MGNSNLNVVNEYVHVGITLVASGNIPCIDIRKKVQACKRAFYSIIGTSLSKTTLSPIALSTLYWSIVVPKLLSGVEARCFSDNEMVEYSKFHKNMAKDIQQLPGNTPDPVVYSMLGWKDIETYVDYMKIVFVHRILSYSPSSVYRILFIRRLYYLCFKGIQYSYSPIVRIIVALNKYDLLKTSLEVGTPLLVGSSKSTALLEEVLHNCGKTTVWVKCLTGEHPMYPTKT